MNYVISIITTLILSGIIGWEREKTHKAAGMRTICFVALSACLSVIFTRELGIISGASFDALRLVSYLIAALGFVGSGCITKDAGGVHGLTTASMLLPVAFIGFFCGIEKFFLAWVTTIVTYLCLIASYITKD